MTRLARLWKELQNNWDVYVVIIGSIIVGIISLILSSVGKLDIAPVLSLTLTMLGLVAISLRRDRRSYTKITESLLDLSVTVGSLKNNRAFSQQHLAYRFLIDEINKDGAKEAVFLQHEDIAAKVGSQWQANRIKEATRHLRTDLSGSLKKPDKLKDKLKVYKYRVLGSVSGIKIDDRVLCMGWYVYKHVDQFTDTEMAGDEVELLGHNIAALVVWKGTPEFEALNETFDMLEENYQRNSVEVPL